MATRDGAGSRAGFGVTHRQLSQPSELTLTRMSHALLPLRDALSPSVFNS
ncbi:MAG: hypothetical protein JNL54_13445 [Kineosporiaceae bacterium]|nr:hypothetical protein [Kineosporiaceae bacterium]